MHKNSKRWQSSIMVQNSTAVHTILTVIQFSVHQKRMKSVFELQLISSPIHAVFAVGFYTVLSCSFRSVLDVNSKLSFNSSIKWVVKLQLKRCTSALPFMLYMSSIWPSNLFLCVFEGDFKPTVTQIESIMDTQQCVDPQQWPKTLSLSYLSNLHCFSIAAQHSGSSYFLTK